MNIRAIIVEDEPLAIDRLRMCLAFSEDVDVIGEAHNGGTAIELIDSLAPDLIFLDVQMPSCSGFEVLRSIARKPGVIFTTAHTEYAVPAFEWGAFDYLLKPFDRERTKLALDRYRQRSGIGEAEPEYVDRLQAIENKGLPLQRFFVKHRGAALPVMVDEILAIIAEGDYCRVCTGTVNHLVHLPLREFEQRLSPERFRRVHRSALIRIDRIQRIEAAGRGAILHMEGGIKVPVSRSGLGHLRSLHL